MSPYLRAFETYHTGGQGLYRWKDLLEAHFQFGAVISTPTGFLMAWPCHTSIPETHTRLLSPLQFTTPPDCWHIWIAAGDLHELLTHASLHPLPFVSWHRRAGALKIHRLATLLARHDKAENATPATTDSPPGLLHRRRT